MKWNSCLFPFKINEESKSFTSKILTPAVYDDDFGRRWNWSRLSFVVVLMY